MLAGKFTEERAATVSYQISSILKYLHRQGIVVRDLRPEHLVFEGKGDAVDIKLIDLSLAMEKTGGFDRLERSPSDNLTL